MTGRVEHQEIQMILCRICKNATSLFSDPCDSKMVGIYMYKMHVKHSYMQYVSAHKLTRQDIVFEQEPGIVIFMSILHEW